MSKNKFLTLGFSVAGADAAAAVGAEAKRERVSGESVTGLRATVWREQLGWYRRADAIKAYQSYLFWRPLCLSDVG